MLVSQNGLVDQISLGQANPPARFPVLIHRLTNRHTLSYDFVHDLHASPYWRKYDILRTLA
jgi:hypothetical protein